MLRSAPSFLRLFALTATMFVAGCSGLPNATRLQLDGTSVSYAASRGVAPTVVFQAGLGEGMSTWAAVLRSLPTDTATFAYDRPGYGGSAWRAGHRDPCAIARELHALLGGLGHPPPYVLVGHSLGGLYQYAFTRLYPDDVGAVLLIDATHPDHWATMQRRAEATALVLRGLRSVAFSETEKREFDAQSECLSALPSGAAPSIPARMLMRGKPELGESAAFQAFSHELAARWPELLPGISLVTVEGAGHAIQKERPERVAEEIRAIIARYRAGR